MMLRHPVLQHAVCATFPTKVVVEISPQDYPADETRPLRRVLVFVSTHLASRQTRRFLTGGIGAELQSGGSCLNELCDWC